MTHVGQLSSAVPCLHHGLTRLFGVATLVAGLHLTVFDESK